MLRNLLLLLLTVGLSLGVTGCHRRTPGPTGAARLSGGSAGATVSRTLYVEPDAGFNWAYALVNNAQHTVDMTMYELVDTTFSGDLVAACGRGVRVRVILDQSLEKNSNTAAYNQINSAGPNCSAAWSNLQFQATHEKAMVVDGARAAIMTFNLTSRYYSGTRDLAVVENDYADIAAIEATFSADYGSTTDLGYQPGPGDDLIWSPTTAQPDLIDLIGSARKSLLVENEEMGASTIVTALEEACQRGVAVEIAMTDTNPNYHDNYTALEKAGCGVHIGANDASTLYVHAKAIVADAGMPQQSGYVGSINFSKASLTENRELGLTVHDVNVLRQVSSAISADYARFPVFP